MSVSRVSAGAAAIATAAVVGLSGAAPAGAAEQWGINGTFATSSNGEWAKVNDRYENQPSTRSTWTISTQCISPTECSGTVNSDAGWSAPVYTTNGLWYIKRVVPNWRFCADGTPVEGMQVYKFYPVGFDGHVDQASSEYAGEDVTKGPSGSCGRNQWPTVRMPFYMRPA
ncbi:hypothetical protein QQ44_17925 [Mycolicibacterium setense]|uniref:Secreted protein n=1 Tax=Mycolicibacterium setense TaxID=431269 RepID=A0ABR4YSJ0_9MYCO|nr:hypothetical protein [Mycolicibacterium setense]KHO24021.1 hypothetical protein QQ44_17925 [Mycolicibacterium setense]